MEKQINRSIKLYPFYYGFVADLLFYIAIDTLFLSLVKNFTPAEIVSLASLSQLFSILLQFPILFVIKKIGNTMSMRAGALFMLLSAIFITFGPNYFVVLLGRIFHDISVIFRNSSVVALENNLEVVDRKSDFIKIRSRGNTIYAIITMLISFVANYMFTLNNYLPMFGCITTCAIAFVLSLFMKDHSPYNKITHTTEHKQPIKIHFNKFLVLTLIAYAVFYTVVTNGQSEGKLFIQEIILDNFDTNKTALIMGAVVCASRIIRVLSNIIFAKIYKKHQDKMGVALPILLSFSIGFMLFGSFIPEIITKILVMSFGFTIILFIRDPYNLYTQDMVFENTPKEQHQTLLTLLTLCMKLAIAGLGLIFSSILLNYPLIVVIAILLIISAIEIVLCLRLSKEISKGKQI